MLSVRRSIANLLLLVGILAGSVAITMHFASASFLDPHKLSENSSQLVTSAPFASFIATALGSEIQPVETAEGAYVTQGQLQSAVATALSQPSIHAQVINDLAEADSRLIGERTGPIVVGGPLFDQIVVAQISHDNSALGNAISEVPLTISIPGTDLPNLHFLVRFANTIETGATLIAAVALIAAVSLHKKHRVVLRRIGIWLLLSAAAGVFVFWVVPTDILAHTPAAWALIASVLLKATATTTLGFTIALVAGGVISLILSALFSAS